MTQSTAVPHILDAICTVVESVFSSSSLRLRQQVKRDIAGVALGYRDCTMLSLSQRRDILARELSSEFRLAVLTCFTLDEHLVFVCHRDDMFVRLKRAQLSCFSETVFIDVSGDQPRHLAGISRDAVASNLCTLIDTLFQVVGGVSQYSQLKEDSFALYTTAFVGILCNYPYVYVDGGTEEVSCLAHEPLLLFEVFVPSSGWVGEGPLWSFSLPNRLSTDDEAANLRFRRECAEHKLSVRSRVVTLPAVAL